MAVAVPSPASSSPSESSSVDPLLDSALSEMETEGFRTEDPVGSDVSAPENESDASPVVAGQTPAADDPAPVARVDAAPVPTADPVDPDEEYAKAPAFTYQADGQSRSLDYIKRFPGEGILIREADVPKLEAELAGGSRYLQQSQQLARQANDLERLTAWDITHPDGSKQTLTGAAAIQAARVAHGNTLAELNTLKEALADPVQLTALIAGMDENGHVVLNRQALEGLATRAELLAMKIQQSVQARFPAQAAQSIAAPAAEPQPDAIVTHIASAMKVAGLTPQDTAQLAAMVPRYIRGATQADRDANPLLKLGEKLVDASFYAQVKYLGDLRTEAASKQTAAVTTATTVTKHNTAMNRARQPQKAAPTGAKPAPVTPQKQTKADAWASVLDNALAELPA